MKKSIQFSTNVKIDLNEKIHLYTDKNGKKTYSNEKYEKIRPILNPSNAKDIAKTINLKKGILLKEQPNVSNILMNCNDYNKKVLKISSKSKNQNEFVIPGKIRIVNGNIYSDSNEKNF